MSKLAWVVVIALVAVFFGPQLIGLLGGLLGAIIGIGITGLVLLGIGAAIFGIVVAVGGSVALAMAITVGAVLLALVSSMWPVLLAVAVLYFIFRKRPETV